MKKADIIVIILVLLLSISFYVIYFSNNNLSDELIVEVTYKNVVVYEVKIEESTNIMVSVSTSNNILTVKIDLDNDGVYDIINPPLAIASDHEIANIIYITYSDIHMHYASCRNKYCYNMKIGRIGVPSPIVCTNGVMIKLTSSEYEGWV